MKQTIISLLMMFLPLMANADAVEIDGIYYNLINKAKVAEVAWISNGDIDHVVIPSSVVYNNVSYPVTSIGGGAFLGCSGLTSVNIPNSVTSIGNDAFQYCDDLKAVNITDLEAWCKIDFANYESNPLIYAQHLFLNGKEVTDLVIPNSVTSIGQYTFFGCCSLASVTIPSSVTGIGHDAFGDCDNLTAVHIIDLDAWCKIELADNGSNPLIYAHHLYLNGNEISELVIPSTVTSIGDYAFSGCYDLTSVTIPNSVTSIGAQVFSGCTGLTSITIPNSVTSIGEGAFYGCSSLTSITIPNSVTSIGVGAFKGCTGLTSITIPNSVTSIGGSAFWGCSSLTSITIPNSVTSIGYRAFENCSSLTSITIPNSVTSIGEYVFSGCSGLTSVIIPNSVTSYGKYAFQNCSGLTSITIGNGVKKIFEYSMANCPELTDIYCYSENVPSTNTNAFDGSYIEHATLHVPESALNAYSNTAPWSNFKYKVAIGEQEQYYALTYMLDGTKYREYSLQEGETITPDPAPIKEGFTFSGWSEIPATMPNHDVTVTGAFIANTYLPGDANGDGQITVTDIGVIVDIILGKTPANARKQQEVVPE